MADIALTYNEENELDLSIVDNDFLIDNTLQTAVLISLAGYRYDDETVRFSWFAENVLNNDIDFGSRLYKILSKTKSGNYLNSVKQYVNEALNWMLLDGVAKEINVQTFPYASADVGFSVDILKPDNTNANFRYFISWENQQIGAIND